MIGDQRDFAILIAVCVVAPAILSFVIYKRFPQWSARKTVLVSALPIPTMIWLLCGFVFLNAAFTPQERCGVDACGMAMGFSLIIAGAALAGFAASVASAWTVCRLVKP